MTGVYFNTKEKLWIATLAIGDKKRVLGSFKTKKMAEKCKISALKEYMKIKNMTKTNLIAFAKLHQNGYSAREIAQHNKIEPNVLRELLKMLDKETNWYNYKESSRANKNNARGAIDNTTKNVYNTFIRTYKSLGYTDAQIWQRLNAIEEKYTRSDMAMPV